ncbi:MAG: ABC transporter permease [Gemmatimonadetes bacterium]|nr:ABC transporter permease [Gemmatimonadota bacterium]
MNAWKTLYLKEIREHRTLFILLPLVTAFLEIIAVLSFHEAQVLPSPHLLWSFVPYAWLFVLPFVLGHSFTQEVKGQTHYLLLSLPVPRAGVFAAKAAMAATLGIILYALTSAGLIAVLGELRALAARAANVSISSFTAVDVLVLNGVVYLSAMGILLGIAGGIAGLRLVVRRFTGLASAAFAIFVLYWYLRTLPEVLALPAILGTYELSLWIESPSVLSVRPDPIEVNFMFPAYTIAVGLASMGLGMWLFERQAEA